MSGTEVVGFNERLEALKVQSKPPCLEKSKYKRGHFVEDSAMIQIILWAGQRPSLLNQITRTGLQKYR